jgi:hypothetical protein
MHSDLPPPSMEMTTANPGQIGCCQFHWHCILMQDTQAMCRSLLPQTNKLFLLFKLMHYCFCLGEEDARPAGREEQSECFDCLGCFSVAVLHSRNLLLSRIKRLVASFAYVSLCHVVRGTISPEMGKFFLCQYHSCLRLQCFSPGPDGGFEREKTTLRPLEPKYNTRKPCSPTA